MKLYRVILVLTAMAISVTTTVNASQFEVSGDWTGQAEQIRRLPAVEPAQVPVSHEGEIVLTSYQDPLMDPAAAGFDPLDPKVQAMLSEVAWKKGKFTLQPYGFVQVNTSWESAQSTRGDYILWVDAVPAGGDQAEFYIDAKSTRLGLNILGPNARGFGGGCYKTSATVEFNFQGAFNGGYYHKPGILFRRAFIEMKNNDWRFLAGQEWDVISPLNPGSINYAVAFASGNLNYRRPQLRVERTIVNSCNLKTLAQFSLNQMVPTSESVDAGSWPLLEGRLGWTIGNRTGSCAMPWVIGISGHIGEGTYNYKAPYPVLVNANRRTWSANIDFTIPVTKRLRILGEMFTGENLLPFWGGIAQGVNPSTGETICSTGGWIEAEYKWSSRARSYVGFGIDDPFNQDLAADARSYNSHIFANIIYNLNKDFEIALEGSSWKTSRIGLEQADLFRLEFMARYKF